MLTANLKTNSVAPQAEDKTPFAIAKDKALVSLKSVGIEDSSDFATAIGYLLVGAYAITMVINLAVQY